MNSWADVDTNSPGLFIDSFFMVYQLFAGYLKPEKIEVIKKNLFGKPNVLCGFWWDIPRYGEWNENNTILKIK